MKQMLSTRLLALGIALGVIGGTAVLVAAAYGGTSSASRRHAPNGAPVAFRKTTLGAILVDARGRTLYLFEKDRRLVRPGAIAMTPADSVSGASPHPSQGQRGASVAAGRRKAPVH